jgi:hypothetical protein
LLFVIRKNLVQLGAIIFIQTTSRMAGGS